MASVCQTCGEPIRDGFYCGCGINQNAVRAFTSKGSQSTETPKIPLDGIVSGRPVGVEEKGAEPEAGSPSVPPTSDENQADGGIATIQGQIADLKAEMKRVEGEIDVLFKQRKSTSSLEWYFFAIDQSNGANDPDDPKCPRGLHLHLLTWGFFGFVWIPIGYILWLTRRSERATWDISLVRETNRKVNDQIRTHRNGRTALLGELSGLKSRMKALAGKDYAPTWHDDPTGAATVALNGAVKETTSSVGRLVKGMVNAVPVGTCPKCQQNWARVHEGEEVICTRHFSKASVKMGTSVEKGVDGVVTETEYYDELYRCSKCSHRWKVSKARSKARTDLCPGCYQGGTEEFIREEEVGRQESVRAKVVRDAIHVDRDDRLVGSTFREVKIHLTTIRFRRYSRCKACGQEWHSTTTHTLEN